MKFKLTNEKNSIKFWIAWLLLGIILVMGYTELVSAESNLGTFKQNTCFDLYQTCDDCTYVNLTAIKYPNGTIETMNLDMVKINQDFTYNFCNSTNLGDYTYTVAGDKRGVYSIETMSFEVTPSGKDGNENIVFFIFIILLIYAITFLGLFNGNAPVTILGGMAMIFLGVYMINNGVIIYQDNLTNYFSYLTIGIGALFGLSAGYDLYQDL